MHFESWVTHVIMQCQDCGWRTEDHLKGQHFALKHAKDRGHFVLGEVAKTCRYSFRSSKLK